MPSFQIPPQLNLSEAEKVLVEFVRLVFQMISDGEPRFKTAKERSQHAIFGGQPPPQDHGLLIDTRQTAQLLNVSHRTVWSMQRDGKMPKPIRIGRAVRWGYEEIKQWVNAGCPQRDEWEKRWPVSV